MSLIVEEIFEELSYTIPLWNFVQPFDFTSRVVVDLWFVILLSLKIMFSSRNSHKLL